MTTPICNGLSSNNFFLFFMYEVVITLPESNTGIKQRSVK